MKKNNIIIDENSIYEIDDDCMRNKEKNKHELKNNIEREITRKQEIMKKNKNWL